jgi:hypothetical protein
MDQSRENTRSAPPSRAAAANTSGGGISHPAVTPFQFNKENKEEEIPVQGQFVSSQQPVQLYTAATLDEQRAAVLAATGSGPDILAANKTAQAALAGELETDDDENFKPEPLTSHFTSMGVESEFAEQPLPPPLAGKKKPPPLENALTVAHIIVSKQAGYALYPDLNFLLETDAGAALEFVTPPLLAPIKKTVAPGNASEQQNADIAKENKKAVDNVVPDPNWEKSVRKGIEKSLRDISSAGVQKVEDIIKEINTAFSLTLPEPKAAYKGIKYGDIVNKSSSPGSHTNVQLNYMTTLQHFMDVNRGTAGAIKGDAKTEEIYKLAMSGDVSRVGANPYVYALSQKLREIPSMLVDETFSILLHSDEKPDEITERGDKALVKTAKENPSFRQALSGSASHIKDGATLWLKASFDQILSGIPADKYEDVYNIMTELHDQKARILAILQNTDQVEALKNFHAGAVINKFITDQLDKLNDLPALHHLTESDIDKKPAEQKTISGERRNIIGGRPDTYAPTDTNISAGQTLFLVETRATTSYLGLKEEDAYGYKPKKAAAGAKVAAAPGAKVAAAPAAGAKAAAKPAVGAKVAATPAKGMVAAKPAVGTSASIPTASAAPAAFLPDDI